jgi:small conductance mechanosensitive channel
MNQASVYSARFIEWLSEFGPRLIGAIIVFVVGLYLTNLAGRVISKGLGKREIDVSLQSFLGSLVSVGLKILLLITVAGMLGIQTTSFVAVIGALGLAVGLALQGSLSNFAGGVLLLVFKPFKIGDLIESGGQTGVVKEIQIFNTIILTADHKTVILANGGVSNGTIVNYSKHGNLRVDISIELAAEIDIEKARTIALDVMAANPFVLKDPPPSFHVSKLGSGSITCAIRSYATPANYWNAYFHIQEELVHAFRKNQIESPIPTTVTINK